MSLLKAKCIIRDPRFIVSILRTVKSFSFTPQTPAPGWTDNFVPCG